MTLREFAVIALAVVALFFGFVAAVGVLRLPDIYTRAHSASKTDTLAAGLALTAAALTFGSDLSTVKSILLLVFMFITNPTAAHAIARAAADQGIEPWTTDDAEEVDE